MGSSKRDIEETLKYYNENFKLNSPYKILLESSFIIEALFKEKVQLKDKLSIYFRSSVTLFTTKCSIEEIKNWTKQRKNRDRIMPAVNEYVVHECRHRKPKSGGKCVQDLLKKCRLSKFVIATNDEVLQKDVLEIYEVPFLQLKKRNLYLFPQSITDKDPSLDPSRISKIKEIPEEKDSLKEIQFKEVRIKVEKLKSPDEQKCEQDSSILQKPTEKKTPVKKMRFRHPALRHRFTENRTQKRFSQSSYFLSPMRKALIAEILKDRSKKMNV